MLLTCVLWASALIAAASAAGPTPYSYGYELKDTTKYKSAFFMFGSDTGTFTDYRNIQLRGLNSGDIVPVVDNSSFVLQAQLKSGVLQAVDYTVHGKKTFTGLTAGLRKNQTYGSSTSYEIIFSETQPKGEVGFKMWSVFDPAGTDGIYTVAAGASNKSDTFLFALCKNDALNYYQLVFAESTSNKTVVKTPPGCTRTELYAIVAPPSKQKG